MSRPIAVIDCETDPFLAGRIPDPFLWGYFDGQEFTYMEQEHADAFIEKLASREQVIYAHNGGRFDYTFLKRYITPGQDVTIINGRLAKFRIGKAEFRDSWNIIPAPLAAYQKTPIDYARMERSVRYKTDNWREIISYLRDDCINLYELVRRFVEKFGRQLTQAGASLKQWLRLSGEEAIENSGEEYFDVFQPWYFGGRVECFKRGIVEEPFKSLDINSAYPFAMTHPHPRGLEYERTPGYVEGADLYRIKARSRGAFAFRSPVDGKLTFPADGKLRTFSVTGWELSAALDTNTHGECRVLESYTWARRESFELYVRHFYEERLAARAAGDTVGDLFGKLFMNSLYGKFAANPARYRRYHVAEELPDDAAELLELRDQGLEPLAEFGGHVLLAAPLKPHQRRYYNVVTAASITGFVRAMLWRAIHACGEGAVLYCDTDSLATHRVGASIELGAKGLGAWKDEGDFIRAGIVGKKTYVFERAAPDAKGSRFKLASKGVSLGAAELYRAARGETVTYHPQVPTFSATRAPRFTPRRVKQTF